jgi:DNA replication protein DnaC
LPELFRGKTFDNFESRRQLKAFKTMQSYTAGQSIVLLSPEIYGVGKTHLVAALINRMIQTVEAARVTKELDVVTNRCPVLFVTENQLLARIRATFNRKSDSEGETEEEIFRTVESAPLLVIDDCGKVRPNDYSFLQGVYFRILDSRYTRRRPIIVTTNLGYEELERHIGGACADRLREMCGKEGFIKMTGESYRKK